MIGCAKIKEMGKIEQITTNALVAILAYMSPIAEIFVVMLLFCLSDLITGIWASRINGIATSSRRARKSVAKLLCYMCAIMLSFSAERAFGVNFASYKMIGGFICLVEFLSILENLTTISGNPVFMKIIDVIRGGSKSSVIVDILNEKNEKEDESK